MYWLRNRYGRFSQIVCFLLAVHILNFSIDPKDQQPDFIPEDLSINEVESITEFFAEVVLGFTNAFAEHDEADGTEGTMDFYKIFITNKSESQILSVGPLSAQEFFISNTTGHALLAREVSSPPPES